MPKIKSVKGLEILDSRGRPTVKAYIELQEDITAAASVPSGASTGTSEAHELRDGEIRFNGLGCKKAVENINSIINQNLAGVTIDSQQQLDQLLIELDHSPNKSNLGANALLAVSLAFARAASKHNKQPLYDYFSNLAGTTVKSLPRPTINLFSGGKHAGAQISIQDLLIVPKQQSMSEVLECSYAIYQSAIGFCEHKYGMRALTADEGGLAPSFETLEDVFKDTMKVIESSGYEVVEDVEFALDVASSQFYRNEKYYLSNSGLSSLEMIEVLSGWAAHYPIISLEDGLAEEDWSHWPILCREIGSDCLVLGDDFLCTNPERIERAIDTKSANALLLKVNQIGTITEALKALVLAKNAGWKITISARSGETEDDWLADLAVGWQGEYIKIGSITQSERLSKYNRLLEIEQELKLTIND